MPRINILGCPVDCISMAETLAQIEDFIRIKEPRQHVVINVAKLVDMKRSDIPLIMGNLHEQSFDESWRGQRTDEIRNNVQSCAKQCWMIGSAAPAMKKRVWMPAKWVVKNKLKLIGNRGDNVGLESDTHLWHTIEQVLRIGVSANIMEW